VIPSPLSGEARPTRGLRVLSRRREREMATKKKSTKKKAAKKTSARKKR